jgi:MFS family permease
LTTSESLPDTASRTEPPPSARPPLDDPATPGPLLDSKTHTAAATWALFTGVGLLMVGNGLQGSLVGIRSQNEGFAPLWTGVVMAGYFAGILAGSRTVTTALRAVGHIRVFAALASMASAAVLAYPLAVFPLAWALMRFTMGACMAGLYVVVESWLNDLATNRTRGRLLAVYMVVTMGGMAAGQFLLGSADPAGFELFLVSSVLVSLSLVPITLSATSTPPMVSLDTMSIRDVARLVPTGLVVSLLVGATAGVLLGMGAVYATSVGLTPSQTALFVASPMAGGVLGQLPVGWVSDHVSRRSVMVGVALVAVGAALGLLVVEPGSALGYVLLFVVGGMSFPLYSLGIAFTNDQLASDQILGASAALVMVNGVGAVLGPLVTAGLTVAFGPSQYFVCLALTHSAVVVFLGYRIVTHHTVPPVADQEHYVPFPARASAMAATLFVRRPGSGRRP